MPAEAFKCVCVLLVLLLVHIARVRILLRHRPHLVLKVPVIQPSRANAEISGKRQPSEVRGQGPASYGIELAPHIHEIACGGRKRDNVYRCLYRSMISEEERHPYEIER